MGDILMAALVDRATIIDVLCTHLRNTVTDFKLVKPYHGELDRYSKKTSLQAETFPAQVNLATPFALVISKDRRKVAGVGNSLRFRHEISIYIGDANTHDFNSITVPPIFNLMKKTLAALDGTAFVRGCGVLEVESDGEYLITTDLFTVYDQKYSQLEISR